MHFETLVKMDGLSPPPVALAAGLGVIVTCKAGIENWKCSEQENWSRQDIAAIQWHSVLHGNESPQMFSRTDAISRGYSICIIHIPPTPSFTLQFSEQAVHRALRHGDKKAYENPKRTRQIYILGTYTYWPYWKPASFAVLHDHMWPDVGQY